MQVLRCRKTSLFSIDFSEFIFTDVREHKFKKINIQIFKVFFCVINSRAGRKHPALVDSSHKVRQGGKGSVWAP